MSNINDRGIVGESFSSSSSSVELSLDNIELLANVEVLADAELLDAAELLDDEELLDDTELLDDAELETDAEAGAENPRERCSETRGLLVVRAVKSVTRARRI